MRKRLVIVLALILMLVPTGMALAEKPAPSLTVETEYNFVGDQGIFDLEGRLLAWKGTVSGDIEEGVIKWYMWMPMTSTGQVNHFADTKWEIWSMDETELLLAGKEFGSTTVRPGKTGVWRANGTVTETSLGFEEWLGRPMHDGGEFEWVIPGVFPCCGWGTLRIN